MPDLDGLLAMAERGSVTLTGEAVRQIVSRNRALEAMVESGKQSRKGLADLTRSLTQEHAQLLQAIQEQRAFHKTRGIEPADYYVVEVLDKLLAAGCGNPAATEG